jgi:hypothetical protein
VPTLNTRPGPPASAAATLRALGWIEARRYARHPLFLVGLGFLIFATASTANDRSSCCSNQIMPAFLLGLIGVFVGFGLARSMQRAEEAIRSGPTDGVLRTVALCLACLVPAAAASVWLAAQFVIYAMWPPTEGWYFEVSTATVLAGLLGGGVVAATGGPLVGVLVGRWTRFPGAGLLAAVALVGWGVLATYGHAMPPSRWATLATLNAPFTPWVFTAGRGTERWWLSAGSPWWHLAYLAMLCGLAGVAAAVRDAVGPRRTRLVGVLAVLVILALVSLALAAAPDPTRIPL